MKTVKKSNSILTPEDLPGAMMQYKPLTEKETQKVAAILEKHKMDKAKKQPKKVLQKAS